MKNPIQIRNPILVSIILSAIALAAFIGGSVWFVMLMPWPTVARIIAILIVVASAGAIVAYSYKRNSDMSGTISIDTKNRTFVLNNVEYDSYERVNHFKSRMFSSSRVPQASGFAATFIKIGVDNNLLMLNSMDAAKGLSLEQLNALEQLVQGSSLSDHDRRLFGSFVATVLVLKNVTK